MRHPVALYRLDAWRPGETRQCRSDPSNTTSAGTDNLVEKIDKAFKTAARTVVPLWNTTNMEVIHRESGFPKASLALAQARIWIGIRFSCLDRNHPISRRADKKVAGAPMTRLQHTTSLAGRMVKPSLFAYNNGAVLSGLEFRGSKRMKPPKVSSNS